VHFIEQDQPQHRADAGDRPQQLIRNRVIDLGSSRQMQLDVADLL
jgi:hypothetical protein